MKNLLFSILLFSFLGLNAQISDYKLILEPVSISGLMGVQSYAIGQYNGKWLIVGGRLDGLHRRQPWASFDINGHNNQLIVVDPLSKQKWTSPLTSLPDSIEEQLSSTNPNFFQEGNTLFFMGGYGYSNTVLNHITYPRLTAIDLPGVINAIINNLPITPYFRQISDNAFAVSGGRLEKIYDTYYLVGGHRFDGRYNPMNNPTFIQSYTNQIRKFKIIHDANGIYVTHLPYITDTLNLHRRDYNVAPQIMPDGKEGLTAFSGVFRLDADLPFLNAVNIDSSSYEVDSNFSQYYNHYHCAHMPVYDSVNNEMHTFFFGGISQYYDSSGVLVQDNNVPFVKTIARVSRNANGVMAEYKSETQMPGLLGAGSEFILNNDIAHYENKVIKLNTIQTDTALLGYIFGGISSSLPNIFFINTGMESAAFNQFFKVKFVNSGITSADVLNPQSISSLRLQVFPNPNEGDFEIRYHLKESTDVYISISDINGKTLKTDTLLNNNAGDYNKKYHFNVEYLNGIYFVNIKTKYESAVQKIIID